MSLFDTVYLYPCYNTGPCYTGPDAELYRIFGEWPVPDSKISPNRTKVTLIDTSLD